MAAFDFGIKVDPAPFDRQINEGYQVNISDYVRQGWEMFQKNIGEFIGFTLVVFVISALSARMNAFGSIIFSALAASLYAGYSIVAFKRLIGQEIQFSDFFKGFNYFLPLFLAGLASGLLVSLGIVLLVIPGIYLAVSYVFVTFLIIDHRMDFWQAMEISRKIITKEWFAVFGLALALFAINLLGVLALGVGLLVSAPVTACAAAIAYKDIVGLHASEW
ncbi:DUF2189 domain-containing protein [Chlorobium phaeobacteroides]|jgi:uncharacterized membrane protein|uniref:Integral membrane protein n=1 Tax=Chlorobium phaeobacteroides (strain DSM 266 / SMG 266 / 2430) TaxID=290317 RepID=A1BIC4_CHLPD|nr:hypothetical protein [Chlorobium phaeobacteroides]ABL66151.1 conserved hypothetical protein [Chlorobium phaeobacteroides DSM 266]MBV5327268.1 hypothetical protein [Chlorobium sp.]